jgi:hypothetical protein
MTADPRYAPEIIALINEAQREARKVDVTYPSRVAANRVRDLIKRLGEALAVKGAER